MYRTDEKNFGYYDGSLDVIHYVASQKTIFLKILKERFVQFNPIMKIRGPNQYIIDR